MMRRLLVCCLLAFACKAKAYEQSAPVDFSKPRLVLFGGVSAADFLLQLFDPQFDLMNHAAFVVLENGELVAYEARGEVGASGKGVAITGSVQRLAFSTVLARADRAEVWALPADLDLAALSARMKSLVGTPYDPHFDSTESTRMYCSEYIARVLQHAGAPPPTQRRFNQHPSVLMMLRQLRANAQMPFYAVRDLTRGANFLAHISRGDAPPGAQLRDEAVGAQLHRRFSATQRLGHVFASPGLSGLAFRREVQEFVTAAQAARDAAEVEVLANERFGGFR